MKTYILDNDKVISVLEEHKNINGEYPNTNQINKIKGVLPSSKWIQRHGGIIIFYKSLGLHYIDARTGIRRAKVATDANKKSQSNDIAFSKALVDAYGERSIHWQSPYNKGKSLHRSDFKVYKKNGDFFFIDLFFPQDMDSFVGCINTKLKKLSSIEIENNAPIYLISCNTEYADPYYIHCFIKARKKKIPNNIHIIHLPDAYGLFGLKSIV
jgi:hypothetical protein